MRYGQTRGFEGKIKSFQGRALNGQVCDSTLIAMGRRFKLLDPLINERRLSILLLTIEAFIPFTEIICTRP